MKSAVDTWNFLQAIFGKETVGQQVTPLFGFNKIFYWNDLTKSTWLFQCRECWSLGHGEMVSFSLALDVFSCSLKKTWKGRKRQHVLKLVPTQWCTRSLLCPKRNIRCYQVELQNTSYTGLADSSELMQLSDVFSGCGLFFISTANSALHLIN